ncbi:unnamed protein product (macronuclear) [Paramecium tetraurelia]|uniref:Uncharacterized protein n=1 Tax=Paramecium tetraurelia TaxID=5888 RepID=A0CB09_PARTE|nr:uncharacterized protein GSPATT00036759001 [Paramecium tetraurelia]CAK67976.1 unnamed protein product [Paramecium tetraurelia]|eukprot:XP_001435373.1 hypothetical protein (macronuclear) [Paramecium tetraurelia strain d4-2]
MCRILKYKSCNQRYDYKVVALGYWWVIRSIQIDYTLLQKRVLALNQLRSIGAIVVCDMTSRIGYLALLQQQALIEDVQYQQQDQEIPKPQSLNWNAAMQNKKVEKKQDGCC